MSEEDIFATFFDALVLAFIDDLQKVVFATCNALGWTPEVDTNKTTAVDMGDVQVDSATSADAGGSRSSMHNSGRGSQSSGRQTSGDADGE